MHEQHLCQVVAKTAEKSLAELGWEPRSAVRFQTDVRCVSFWWPSADQSRELSGPAPAPWLGSERHPSAWRAWSRSRISCGV